MKLTHLLTFNAILFIAAGIAFALYGPVMINLYGVLDLEGGDAATYWFTASFARLFGAALFGFGFLINAVRPFAEPAAPPAARRNVVFALLLANLMGVFVAGTQQVSVWITPAGIVTILVYAILLLGYAYFIARPNA